MRFPLCLNCPFVEFLPHQVLHGTSFVCDECDGCSILREQAKMPHSHLILNWFQCVTICFILCNKNLNVPFILHITMHENLDVYQVGCFEIDGEALILPLLLIISNNMLFWFIMWLIANLICRTSSLRWEIGTSIRHGLSHSESLLHFPLKLFQSLE